MADALAPWLAAPWELVLQRHRNNALPHALLIQGIAGIGKQVLAKQISDTLLCQREDDNACGECTTCQLVLAGTHPDTRLIAPLDGDAFIKVDAVRELITWLQLTPHFEAGKIAIINDAHAMNRNAANSLLKTLEEPAPKTLILLLTDSPGSVPATVRSRCQAMALTSGSTASAQDWLEAQGVSDAASMLSLAGGGPFRALSMADSEFPEQRKRLFKAFGDIVLGQSSIARAVESISEVPTALCLRSFAGWTSDLVKLQADQAARIGHEPDREAISAWIGAMKTDDWFALYDQICRLHRIDSTSFKTQTVLEGLFADIRLKQVTV